MKAQLSEEFYMKDLSTKMKIFGVEILRDEKSGIFYLSWEGYVEKLLYLFNMLNGKAISTHWVAYFKLSSTLHP